MDIFDIQTLPEDVQIDGPVDFDNGVSLDSYYCILA